MGIACFISPCKFGQEVRIPLAQVERVRVVDKRIQLSATGALHTTAVAEAQIAASCDFVGQKRAWVDLEIVIVEGGILGNLLRFNVGLFRSKTELIAPFAFLKTIVGVGRKNIFGIEEFIFAQWIKGIYPRVNVRVVATESVEVITHDHLHSAFKSGAFSPLLGIID